jgi:hypothetical protein
MDDINETVVAQLASELACTSALLQAAYARLSWLEGVSPPDLSLAQGTEESPE